MIITFENGTSKALRIDSTTIQPVTGGYFIVDPSVVLGQPLPATTISSKVVNQINAAIPIAITIVQQSPPPTPSIPTPPPPNFTEPQPPPEPPICPEGTILQRDNCVPFIQPEPEPEPDGDENQEE